MKAELFEQEIDQFVRAVVGGVEDAVGERLVCELHQVDADAAISQLARGVADEHPVDLLGELEHGCRARTHRHDPPGHLGPGELRAAISQRRQQARLEERGLADAARTVEAEQVRRQRPAEPQALQHEPGGAVAVVDDGLLRLYCIGFTAMGGAIGFYDGFFGPGTGSFLIFLFIRFFGFDFLHASAAAKIVNVATNLAAIAYFAPNGYYLPVLAVVMAIGNVGGSFLGTHLALRHGSGFVRKVFLIVVSALIVKFAWDTF